MEQDIHPYNGDIGKLKNAVVFRFSLFALLLGFLLFFSAGTLLYWQAWVYLGFLFSFGIFFCAFFLKYNPALMERRLRMKEKEKPQRLLIKTSFLIFLLAWILPGIDHRFGWSSVPADISLLANIGVLAGYLFIFFVLKENEYASRIIEIEKDQIVIATGPYAFIRHPMYLGGIIMYLFTPLALGSRWALLAALFVPVIFIIRLIHEENFLKENLGGYADYMQKVKYRLIPFVW